MKKHIAILGSTGSIGTQALEVIEEHKDQFEVEVLTAQNNYKLLAEQAIKFNPNCVVISNEDHYQALQSLLESTDIKVYAGAEALEQVVEMESVQIVLTALVGFAGLKPTIKAIEAGKHIALANKETLVVAGDIITTKAMQHKVMILPVDSEHSAIFQCMAGEYHNPIEKLTLTASGGPFRGKDKDFLKDVKPEQALKHPNWDMGNKITIDSASLMNKGLEVIEARWLFGLSADNIDVIVHPQSIIHSMVQYEDGSIKAQMGLPDMKLPIQYALSFPNRIKNNFPRFSFVDYPNLSFEKPDMDNFRNLALAYDALRKGGNMPCILNAANELAVQAFLQGKIGFLEMSDWVEQSMNNVFFIEKPSLEDYLKSDEEARLYLQNKYNI
jgi:1-deoxy-D-xylulose-5-phosphate reductoisomerase